MENQQEYREKSSVLDGVASVLNAGGSAMVYAYDVAAVAFDRLFPLAKKIPAVSGKAFGTVAGGFGIIKPGETKRVEEKIRGYEKRIKGLYYKIGQEGARVKDLESPLETEPVKRLISEVREYEKDIQRLENRITEIRKEKREKALRKKGEKAAAKLAVEKTEITDEQVLKAVGSAIEKALRRGAFESLSERERFDKVASDLLDSDMEIKGLAVAELGKMGNEAAVPILMEAVRFKNPDLTSEIINSLISIGIPEAISLFKEKVTDPEYMVRIGCLRGLYKLADDEDAIPLLTDALMDQHPEVRRNAATFLGWKDYTDAVPALAQCLKDEEVMVRKAAVSALANIKEESSVLALIKVLGDGDMEIRENALDAIRVISGEEIAFDVHASGEALRKAIDDLRDWWQEKRLGGVEVIEAAEPEAAEEIAEAEEVAAEPEAAEEIEEPETAVTPPEQIGFTKHELRIMPKSEVLSICKELGIECDETLSKPQIVKLILGEEE